MRKTVFLAALALTAFAPFSAEAFLGESCRTGRQWVQVVNFSEYFLEIKFDGVPFSSEEENIILFPGNRLTRCVSQDAKTAEIVARKNFPLLMQVAVRHAVLNVPDLNEPAFIAVRNENLPERISLFHPLNREHLFFIVFMLGLAAFTVWAWRLLFLVILKRQ